MGNPVSRDYGDCMSHQLPPVQHKHIPPKDSRFALQWLNKWAWSYLSTTQQLQACCNTPSQFLNKEHANNPETLWCPHPEPLAKHNGQQKIDYRSQETRYVGGTIHVPMALAVSCLVSV